MNEIWRSIKDYEDLYEVSNWGRVRNSRTGLILKPGSSKGYLYVQLYKNKIPKMFKVHRLVAQAFLPNPDNLPCVNHKDENPSNNRLDNLEWCTIKYNNNYGTLPERRKLQKRFHKPVYQYSLDGVFLFEYTSLAECATVNGYDSSLISRVCLNKGEYKTAYGYRWSYFKQ